MKLLKRNILNGQTVEVNGSDAFDEICANNFGSLEDWDIKCFSEFEKAFKEDKEMEITCNEWTFSNVLDKKTHEDFTLEWREGNLLEYMEDLVKTTEWVLRDLKDYQKRINDKKYLENCKMEDIVKWAINRVQQVNYKFDNGADVIARYVEAKIRKELAKEQA